MTLDLCGGFGHMGEKVSRRLTMDFLKRLVTWWNGQTLGTQLYTSRKGVKVGEDDQGNIYYETRDGKRRWVIYNGEAEASRVSPDWHGWLHHTWSEPPTKAPLKHKAWEKPHQENLTGTSAAYAPPGSIRRPEPVARRDYEAWQPE
jgi:NADH:ubiquinone oxidoreductase subunit